MSSELCFSLSLNDSLELERKDFIFAIFLSRGCTQRSEFCKVRKVKGCSVRTALLRFHFISVAFNGHHCATKMFYYLVQLCMCFRKKVVLI